jgi:hypothetical protein
LKDVSEIYYFSGGDASQARKGKISSTSAIIQMILVLMLMGTLYIKWRRYVTQDKKKKKLQGMSVKLL